MDSLRELWSREGPNIISTTLQSHNGEPPSSLHNEYLPTAVFDTMTTLFDQFLEKNRSAASRTQVEIGSRGQEVTVSGWDRIQDSRSVKDHGPEVSFASRFLSTPPESTDFDTLFNSDSTSVLKDSGLDEPMMESGGWGDFLAEGCHSWTDFSAPAERSA
ncbi:hypothetical protein CGLO_15465 [Colletotrichum gloeosporioides Cg-14]|uniref:Uncharacterized protein n=1 Tax=Colletotrichum gloeosporioides (strain Cg-14) TaxID=1237896 RepID=T0K1P6_COLGC|nr:hypothetical protein CGLO_15465 [Colletotrichum gloeosporioides Cg-14]